MKIRNIVPLRSVYLTSGAAALLSLSTVFAQTTRDIPRPKTAGPASAILIDDLVTANRILAEEGISTLTDM